MRFSPGQDVVFYLDDGSTVLARPFFFQRPPSRTMDVEFVTTDGARIRCVDVFKQRFQLATTGQFCFLEEPRFRDPPVGPR